MKKTIRRVIALLLSCLICLTPLSVAFAEGEGSEIEREKEEIIANQTLTQKQLSAISMLNYLSVLSMEINKSSNSKLYLDNAYSAIVNNVNPNSVDKYSMEQIRSLLSTINAYQSIARKRERLQYIYQQNQAKAMQNAIPNPMSVLNVVQSGNPAKALVSVVYMAVDAKSSYDSYVSEVESKYMQDGWVLDDLAAENLNESRADAFGYMVDMCNANNLDGKLALNENAVEDFVKWEKETNVTRKIEYLEKNKETYKAYGKYWLVLAESYYSGGNTNGNYQKCLNCIQEYESMNVVTFRKDHDLAKTMTIGLAAANEIKKGDSYEELANHYLDVMLGNIELSDWVIRYVAAETYMDLYAKNQNKLYLNKAYELAMENVNYLIDTQFEKNDDYLKDIVKQSEKGQSSAKKKEIKSYNKWLEEERKTELPPVYEPLVVNCELLFGLAEKLNLSSAEKKKVNDMLHSGEKPLFLVTQLENKYSYGESKTKDMPGIVMDEKEIRIPASILSQGTSVKATITSNNQSLTYDDLVLDEVDRNKQASVDKFLAVYKSKALKKYDYKNGDKVTITITPGENSGYDALVYVFNVSVTKSHKVVKNVSFVLEK